MSAVSCLASRRTTSLEASFAACLSAAEPNVSAISVATSVASPTLYPVLEVLAGSQPPLIRRRAAAVPPNVRKSPAPAIASIEKVRRLSLESSPLFAALPRRILWPFAIEDYQTNDPYYKGSQSSDYSNRSDGIRDPDTGSGKR